MGNHLPAWIPFGSHGVAKTGDLSHYKSILCRGEGVPAEKQTVPFTLQRNSNAHTHQMADDSPVLFALVANGCGYNTLQQMEEKVFRSWSDVESNLQRRADLIPNLVATVKGFAAHEKDTLQAVVEARAKATSVQLSPKDLGNAQAMQQMLDAQGGLSSALSRLMVVVERYPDLKANQNFLDLQNQLEGTENRINVARQRYNQAVEGIQW
jgi:LemA protein